MLTACLGEQYCNRYAVLQDKWTNQVEEQCYRVLRVVPMQTNGARVYNCIYILRYDKHIYATNARGVSANRPQRFWFTMLLLNVFAFTHLNGFAGLIRGCELFLAVSNCVYDSERDPYDQQTQGSSKESKDDYGRSSGWNLRWVFDLSWKCQVQLCSFEIRCGRRSDKAV